jgi:hypothetical protein
MLSIQSIRFGLTHEFENKARFKPGQAGFFVGELEKVSSAIRIDRDTLKQIDRGKDLSALSLETPRVNGSFPAHNASWDYKAGQLRQLGITQDQYGPVTKIDYAIAKRIEELRSTTSDFQPSRYTVSYRRETRRGKGGSEEISGSELVRKVDSQELKTF